MLLVRVPVVIGIHLLEVQASLRSEFVSQIQSLLQDMDHNASQGQRKRPAAILNA
jgi:hypothetical protein